MARRARLPSGKHIIPPTQRHVPSRHWLLAIFAESSGGLARNPETARELIAEFEDMCNRLERMDETEEISINWTQETGHGQSKECVASRNAGKLDYA